MHKVVEGIGCSNGFAWSPDSRIGFIPTGKIDKASLAAYQALKNVVAVGGSWMLPKH